VFVVPVLVRAYIDTDVGSFVVVCQRDHVQAGAADHMKILYYTANLHQDVTVAATAAVGSVIDTANLSRIVVTGVEHFHTADFEMKVDKRRILGMSQCRRGHIFEIVASAGRAADHQKVSLVVVGRMGELEEGDFASVAVNVDGDPMKSLDCFVTIVEVMMIEDYSGDVDAGGLQSGEDF
jgi:hypothetical protein